VRKLIVIALSYSIFFGCTLSRRVRRDMSWSPAERPLLGSAGAPYPQGTVRFTFDSAPQDHVVVVSPDLMERLRRNRQTMVSVEFEIHCNAFGRRVGWISVQTVAGQAVAPVSGIYEHSGLPGPDPLSCP